MPEPLPSFSGAVVAAVSLVSSHMTLHHVQEISTLLRIIAQVLTPRDDSAGALSHDIAAPRAPHEVNRR